MDRVPFFQLAAFFRIFDFFCRFSLVSLSPTNELMINTFPELTTMLFIYSFIYLFIHFHKTVDESKMIKIIKKKKQQWRKSSKSNLLEVIDLNQFTVR